MLTTIDNTRRSIYSRYTIYFAHQVPVSSCITHVMTGSLAGTPIHRVEEHGGGEGEAEEADNLHLGRYRYLLLTRSWGAELLYIYERGRHMWMKTDSFSGIPNTKYLFNNMIFKLNLLNRKQLSVE